jgi:hypothetical protein
MNMKTIVTLLGLTFLLTTVGCEIEEHEHRGGYYGPRESGHGEYRGYPEGYDHHDEHYYQPEDNRD